MQPRLRTIAIEGLEARRLLVGEPLSSAAQLIGLDRLRAAFPDLNGAGQTVAVIDTGIDYTIPALGGGFGPGFKVVGGWDFVDDDPDPIDTDGHGTAVAGVIAADPFVMEGIGYGGIAPAAALVALRISPDTNTTPNSRIAAALEWVLANRESFGITAVNISFGFGRFNVEPDDGVFAGVLANLADAGVIVAAAAGNGGADPTGGIEYPAADPSVVGVGSVDTFDVISEFGKRGRLIDVLAPGEGWATPTRDGAPQGDRSGTSFAAPVVTAAAVLLKQVIPDLTVRDARSILRASGKDNLDGDDEFGRTTGLLFSRVDLAAAAQLAAARRPDPLAPPPDWAMAQANVVRYDDQGVMHVAYHDATTRTIRYATRLTDGRWAVRNVEDPASGPRDLGRYLSLAIDAAGRPGIAYFDGTGGDLRYARLVEGQFAIDVIDSRQSVGLYPSTVFRPDNSPVVAYYHRSKGDLRIARFDGLAWAIDDIDRDANDRGRSASLAINSFNRLAVAYEDSTTGKLKFAVQTTGGRWAVDTVDNNTAGVSYISAAFDKNDRLGVSYYDASPADLKFAVTTDPFRANWKAVTVSKKGTVGLFSQLSFGDDGKANILFYNRNQDALYLARGSVNAMVASKVQSGGGRFSSAVRHPQTGGITYTYYQLANQRLQFGEMLI